MPTYTLNFSRGSAMVLAQYYNFLRLGMSGFRDIMTNMVDNSRYLAEKLVNSGRFKSLNKVQMLPIVTVQLSEKKDYTVFDLSHKLRERGWIVPAYTLPPKAEKTAILRVVCRENFSRDMANLFFQDTMNACEDFENTARGNVIKIPTKQSKEHPHLHRAC